jgi:hypothetical protein
VIRVCRVYKARRVIRELKVLRVTSDHRVRKVIKDSKAYKVGPEIPVLRVRKDLLAQPDRKERRVIQDLRDHRERLAWDSANVRLLSCSGTGRTLPPDQHPPALPLTETTFG